MSAARAERRAAWLFLAPGLGLIGVFFLLPVAAALLLSFTDFDIYALADPRNARVVGLANYARLLGSPEFWGALRNTLYFVLVGGPLSILVALGAALLLNARAVRLRALFRTVYFAPFVTTLVAVALVWRYLYHPRYGLLNYALGLVGIGPIDWLADPRWAMPAIILLAVWKNFGYSMLVFLAGLQTVPEELYEAARLDGAGAWQRFKRVVLPLSAPAIMGAALVVLALSWDEFQITFFTIGDRSTLPLVIWSRARRVIDPSVNAVGTLMIAGSLLIVLLTRGLIVESYS